MPRALRAIACNCVQSHDICSKDQCVCSGLEVAVEGVVAAATVEEAVEGAATPGIRAAVEVAVDVAVEGGVAVAVGVVAAAAWAVGVDVAAVAAVVVAADAGLVVDAEDATTAVEAVASSLDVVDVVWETTAWAEFSCGLTMAKVLMLPPPPPPLPPSAGAPGFGDNQPVMDRVGNMPSAAASQMQRNPTQMPMNINALRLMTDGSQAPGLPGEAVFLAVFGVQLSSHATGATYGAFGPQEEQVITEGVAGGNAPPGARGSQQPQTPPDVPNLAQQSMMRSMVTPQSQPPQHPAPKLQTKEEAQPAQPPAAVPNAQGDPNSHFTFEVYLQRHEGMRLGLSVLPVTMHDVAVLWVNEVSEGGAVDAWNKSVCSAFQVRSGDAITRVFNAVGDHAKMMEELQSHRNIRLAVVRQGGNNPSVPAGAKAPAKAPPQLPQQVPKQGPGAPMRPQDDPVGVRGGLAGAVPEDTQNLLGGQASAMNASRMPKPGANQAPNEFAEQLQDALEKASAPPPGLAKPLVPSDPQPLGSSADDAGDLMGSIDVQETGANGPLRFQVVLARKGPGRLGIDVVLKREANFCGLLVYKVSEGGRVDAWNKQSQMPYRVLPGDHILEVNDLSISGDSNPQNDKFAVRMVQELSKDRKNVHFTVERVPLGSELPQEEENAQVFEQGDPRRPGQMMPRQVGPQQTLEGGQEVEAAQGAVPKPGNQLPAAPKTAKAQPAVQPPPAKPGQPKSTPPAIAPKWQPKSAALPGQKSEETDSVDVDLEPPEGAMLAVTAIPDGEASDQASPADEPKEEKEEKDNKESKEPEPKKAEPEKKEEEAKPETEESPPAAAVSAEAAAEPTQPTAEQANAAGKDPEPANPATAPPATAPPAAPPVQVSKAPPVKAKPAGASAESGPAAPPPASPSSRPLPPPPKMVAPPKPGPKAKSKPEEKEAKDDKEAKPEKPEKPEKAEAKAEAKSQGLPAPPAGPAPPPPEGEAAPAAPADTSQPAASPKAKSQG
ncbi:svop [Symbiodinium pilosum]|uniref:Svop protein n=1 Tax=Symbiodinium pilosum TaxID=2952 RepID=A0A812L207_SYMPI|nr:svop [Symbiodinium pilosum]